MSALRASALLLLALGRCGDPGPFIDGCAEGDLAACRRACDRGHDASCVTGGKKILLAVDKGELPRSDDERAFALLALACERSGEGCALAAWARDDGVSQAALPWLERACAADDAESCRDRVTTRLGEEEPEDALGRLCRLDVQRKPRPDGGARRRPPPPDVASCRAGLRAAHLAAASAGAACERGEARGCEQLADLLVDEREAFTQFDGVCVEVLAPGLSPLGGGLACERAGRAYARACALRGLAARGPTAESCTSWLLRTARQRRRFPERERPPAPAGVRVEVGPEVAPALAAALGALGPALHACWEPPAELGRSAGDAGPPPGAPPRRASGTVELRFVLDRTGRPAWLWARSPARDVAGSVATCLGRAVLAADLGVPGDGATEQRVKLQVSGPVP